MQGCYLTEGNLASVKNEDYFSYVLQSFQGKHTNSYKYCFFKALLDNLFNFKSLSIHLDILGESFAEIYWNSVSVHGIPVQNRNISSVEKIIKDCQSNYPYMAGTRFESLNPKNRALYVKEILKIFPKYVVGAFYGDTQGTIYGFSKKAKTLWLSEESYTFLTEHKYLLEQLNYYEWLKYVEGLLKKANRSIPNLSTVLEDISKRTQLGSFKQQLTAKGEPHECFYCGTPVSPNAPLDHVIPWSYIKNDDLWNLVFVCSTCNSRKSNQIPETSFVKKLDLRNHKLHITSPNITDVIDKAKKNGIKDGWKP